MKHRSVIEVVSRAMAHAKCPACGKVHASAMEPSYLPTWVFCDCDKPKTYLKPVSRNIGIFLITDGIQIGEIFEPTGDDIATVQWLVPVAEADTLPNEDMAFISLARIHFGYILQTLDKNGGKAILYRFQM